MNVSKTSFNILCLIFYRLALIMPAVNLRNSGDHGIKPKLATFPKTRANTGFSGQIVIKDCVWVFDVGCVGQCYKNTRERVLHVKGDDP